MKIKVGIIFDGVSRQREKSFLAARFLYLHLPAYAIEKVLIRIDQEGKYYAVEEICLFHNDLSEFDSQEIAPSSLGQYLHMALVTIPADDLHAEALYEALVLSNIPNNLHPFSRKFALDLANWWDALKTNNFRSPSYKKVSLSDWDQATIVPFYHEIKKELGESIQIIPLPCSAGNGGSVLVSDTKPDIFEERVNRAFFRDWIQKSDWQSRTEAEKRAWTTWLSNPSEGPDFPLQLLMDGKVKAQILQPQDFIKNVEDLFAADSSENPVIGIEPIHRQAHIHFVGIPNGVPFRSVIWQQEDSWHCLPPMIHRELLPPGKNQFEPLSELQSAAISDQMLQIGRSFSFNSPQVISGFVSSGGKPYAIEIQPFLEVFDEEKWVHHLGAIDHTPTSFLEIVVSQILRRQADAGGLVGKIAAQLSRVFIENQETVPTTAPQVILLDALERVNIEQIKEVIGWYETLAVFSRAENLIIFSENREAGLFFYTVPSRWLYLAIQKNIEPGDLTEKMKRHSSEIDATSLKEKGSILIPVSSGNIRTKSRLFRFLEAEKIPYWGPPASFSDLNYDRHIQLETLNKSGFQTLPLLPISTWMHQSIAPTDRFVLCSNNDAHRLRGIEISGEHEIKAFKQFLTDPPAADETQRNRKLWNRFYTEIGEGDRQKAFLQKTDDLDDFIISFFKVRTNQDSFERRYLYPVQVTKGEDQEINYLFSPNQSEDLREIRTVWTPLTEQIDAALNLLGIHSVGYVRFRITFSENRGFDLLIKEVCPLLSVRAPWVEKQLLKHAISWEFLVSQQNDYAQDSMQHEVIIREIEENKIQSEEIKLPFHHQNSELVSEREEQQQESRIVKNDYSRKKAMNPLNQPQEVSNNAKSDHQGMWGFLKSRFFIKNVIAFIAVFILIVQIIKGILFLYTRHGSGKEVMDFSGMRFESALERARDQGFSLIAGDVVYVLNRPEGIILSQVPEKGSIIKAGRTIYCVITGGKAPSVQLPKLSNNDEYEAYQRQLIRLGLYSRIREERFEAEYEEKTILDVYFEGKKLSIARINAGQVKLPKGSYLDFVISVRNTDKTPVPDLVCKTYEEAVTNLDAYDLSVGTIMGPSQNESFSGMYVVKQVPAPGAGVFLAKGSQVDLYLQVERPSQCPEYQR